MDVPVKEPEYQIRRRYTHWRENHPIIPVEQLKTWEEMSEGQREQWVEKNPPVSPKDEDIIAAGKEWIEQQIAALTPEQREAAAIYFHGQNIGGPPPERFFNFLGATLLTNEKWREKFPKLSEAYAQAIAKKMYQ